MTWDDAEPTTQPPRASTPPEPTREPSTPEPTRESASTEPTSLLPAAEPTRVLPSAPDSTDQPDPGSTHRATPATPAPQASPSLADELLGGSGEAADAGSGPAGPGNTGGGPVGIGSEAAGDPVLRATTPPSGGTTPLPAPGSGGYRLSRSTSQRSFGRSGSPEPAFQPVYPGQAWPTVQPSYPPPPLDWHQQQARAYTAAPAAKDSRVITIAAVVALIIGLIAGAGAAGVVIALDDGPSFDTTSGPPVGNGPDPRIKPGSVSSVAQALLPSVVQLKVEGSDDSNSTGSGFVIDTAGHILTNNHVVSAAAQGGTIQVVTQKGKSATARLVGRSPAYDLAVVQVSGIEAPAVRFGQSEGAIVGQDVVAIGSPLGLAGTVTSGIVSAKNRPVTAGGEGEISYINALQTDAAINPGNSGGPLVDMDAKVIGVNSAIATVRGTEEGQGGNIGLGFAIPIDQARRTAQQLIKTGQASYPVIGANVDMRFEGGARVSEVVANSPAQRAGLRVGDVITSINNQPVDSAEALIVSIRSHQPGEAVRLAVERSGRSRQVTVTLGQKTG